MKSISKLFFCEAILLSITFIECKSKTSQYQPVFSNGTHDKKILLFGVPTQSYYELSDSMVKYLNSHIHGVRIQTVATSNYGQYKEQLAQGYYDLTIANAITALNSLPTGYIIIGKVVDTTGNSGSIVVNKDSSIYTLEDMKGKTVATYGSGSIPGHMLQLLYLNKQGLDVSRDIRFRYVESFESVFLNVYLGKCSIGFSNSMSWNSFVKARPEIASKVIRKWLIPGVIGSAVLFRKDMDKEVAADLRALLLSMHTNQQGKAALAKVGFLRFEQADSGAYHPIREIVKEYNSLGTDY